MIHFKRYSKKYKVVSFISMLGLFLFARPFVYNDKIVKREFLVLGEVLTAPNTINEQYEIIKTYEQDSIAERDPKFKRILFWNQVRKKTAKLL